MTDKTVNIELVNFGSQKALDEDGGEWAFVHFLDDEGLACNFLEDAVVGILKKVGVEEYTDILKSDYCDRVLN